MFSGSGLGPNGNDKSYPSGADMCKMCKFVDYEVSRALFKVVSALVMRFKEEVIDMRISTFVGAEQLVH